MAAIYNDLKAVEQEVANDTDDEDDDKESSQVEQWHWDKRRSVWRFRVPPKGCSMLYPGQAVNTQKLDTTGQPINCGRVLQSEAIEQHSGCKMDTEFTLQLSQGYYY